MQRTITQEKVGEYIRADMRTKSQIVTSICVVTGMHRKSVLRALARERVRSNWKSPPSRRGRPRVYTAETDAVLAYIWEQYNYPSAERLHGEVAEAVRIFRRDGLLPYSEEAIAGLLRMSLGAMKVRTTAFAKKRHLLRGISTTRSSAVLRSVPVFFGPWGHKGTGYGQIDAVVHSGPKLMGTMVYTVNYVDVATYWQEPVAQLDKTAVATSASLQTISGRLPWKLKGIHPDSGSEFMNELAYGWCQRRRVELTRSRPHKKNDNCYVEQRNLVVVRKYVGYERYDCLQAVEALNVLYATLRLYLNFFQPTFKLQGKLKLPGGRYRRLYDTPQTPYQRALKRDDVFPGVKARLKAQYETLNPRLLREKIQVLTRNLERIQRAQGYHF